jgi:putative SOS response-associated peptidase YedK
MPIRINNLLSQSAVEDITKAKLVPFLDWQTFQMVEPTQGFPVITNEFNNVLQILQWGLVPSWAKNPKMGANLYRTKYENLVEKSSLQAIYDYKRCVVPVTSFVVKTESNNLFELAAPQGGLYLLAGLWAVWGEGLYSFSIITRQGQIQQEEAHLPFMLSSSTCKEWLRKYNIPLSFLSNLNPSNNM